MLGVVRISARIGVHQAVFEGPIDEDGELASGGGNRLRLPDAEGQTAIERAQSRLGAAEVHRGEPQDPRRAVGGRWRVTAEEATARHSVVRRDGEPGREVFLRWP